MDITSGIQPLLPDDDSRGSAIQDTGLSPEIKGILMEIEKLGYDTRLFDLLYDCPGQGSGINPWLFDVAYQLVLYFKDDSDAEDILYEYVDGSLPHERRDREIPMAVKSARRYRFMSPEERLASSPTPKAKVRYSYINKEVRAKAKDLADGWPHWTPIKEPALEAEPVLDTICLENPLICGGINFGAVITRPREYFRGREAQMQFIVPNPMTAMTGTTKNGNPGSARTLDNTGPRVYLVLDFDFKRGKEPWGPYIAKWEKKGISVWDAQTLIIRKLSIKAEADGYPTLPLTMVVFSGNISLQAWYYVAHLHEDQIAAFFERAVSLGADPQTWRRCQLVRWPGGTRSDKDDHSVVVGQQSVIYLDPATIRIK